MDLDFRRLLLPKGDSRQKRYPKSSEDHGMLSAGHKTATLIIEGKTYRYFAIIRTILDQRGYELQ